MYTVIRHYTVTSGSVDDALKQVEAGFVPIVQRIKGFDAYYALKTGDGGLATVSVFETEAGCTESTTAAANWLQSNTPDFTTDAPRIIAGETVIHARALATAEN
ncbi:MAG TPA: hypothetical protein VFW89_07465 [Gemmatimonadaceae bacterium]|nr:hypothetical protein [Gemmatimonadaceae bacterium]